MASILLDVIRTHQEAIFAQGIAQARQRGSHHTVVSEGELQRSFAAILEALTDYWERGDKARAQTWAATRTHLSTKVGVSPAEVVSGLDLLSELIRSHLVAHLRQSPALLAALTQLDQGVSFLRRCYLEAHYALSEQRLTRLCELTVAIGAELSLEQTLRRTVAAARELAGARYAALGVPDADGSMAQFITAGLSDEERAVIGDPPNGRGLLGTLLRHGKPISRRNLGQDPRSVGFPPGYPPIRSFLGVPILSHGRVVGGLYLTEKEGAEEFSPDDQRLIELLAAHAAVAIDTARLHEGVRRHSFERQALYELSQQVGYTLTYDEFVRLLLEHLSRAVPHDVSASILRTGNLGNLCIRPTRPLSPMVQEDIQTRLVQSLVRLSGEAMGLEPERLRLRTLESEAFDATRPSMARLGSAFQVPLIVGQGHEVVGLLFVGAEPEGAFTEDQVRLLYTVANQASLSIQRLRTLLDEAQQQRLQSLVEHFPEGILMVDADGRLVLANPAAKGYLAALTDMGVGDVLTHLGGCPIEELLRPPPEGLYHEVEADRPPYRVFEVEARALQVGPDSGGWVLVLRDVTEDRQVQERVQQQERLAAVGELAAGIAHDFNNLLTGIIGFADMLQQRPDMPEPARARLARIVEQGERGAHLVRQILDFSRTSISQLLSLDLALFLREAAKFLERTIPESIRIALDIDPGEYVVRADPTRIQQVLTNLAVNAWDAMPAGGELKLRLYRFTRQPGERPPCLGMPPGEWVVVSVSDAGTGISADALPRIFEPFFTTKEPGRGTGLGLAQVYGIIKQHEGYIKAESRDGAGTTVLIYLPALAVPQEAPREETPEDIPRGHGETVLLVEDEPAVLEVGQAILEQLGYRVLTACNGQQALEVYVAHQDEIALALIDMVMPVMGGGELFQALRALNPAVKVVMTTGYPLEEEGKQLLAQGILDWLQKPVKPAQLAQAVSRALQD
jgi:signal transduction histidine kinase/transcriptional regulator with GAF, ATPase, and Fis domain/ActR/RegA family two-component response regulator